MVKEIDTKKKTVSACFPADDTGIDAACFQLNYDILVLGKWSTCHTCHWL